MHSLNKEFLNKSRILKSIMQRQTLIQDAFFVWIYHTGPEAKQAATNSVTGVTESESYADFWYISGMAHTYE